MRPNILTSTLAALATLPALAQATPLTTTDAAVVAAFQQGLTVQTFEQVEGRTPKAITAYTVDDDVAVGARVYDQVPGFRFSSGGNVGQVTVGLFELGGDIAGGAVSGDTVLAPLSMDNQTKFDDQVFLEGFLPSRVSSLGFWITPLDTRVRVFFANSNFAFDNTVDEVSYDDIVVTERTFVGLTRAQADIGGLKILSLGPRVAGQPGRGFTIDDLSFGIADDGGGGDDDGNTVPEPASAVLALGALAALRLRRQAR